MSTTSVTKNELENDGTMTVGHGLESSNDSSGSSDSSSGSTDVSGESTGSSSDEQDDDPGDQAVVDEHESAGSVASNESFKSFNASGVKSISGQAESSAVTTPAKVLVSNKVKSAKSNSVGLIDVKTSEVPKPGSVASAVVEVPVSPVPATPGKSMVLKTSPQEQEVDFDQLNLDTKSGTDVVNRPALHDRVESRPVANSEDVSEQESVKSASAVAVKERDRHASRKRARRSSRTSIKEIRSPKLKRNKGDKMDKMDKTDKAEKLKARKSKSVEKVEEQVRLLQEQLDEVREAGVGHLKRSKKVKKHRSVKAKKAKSSPSAADSSQSSASEGPTTSTRIGKIPMSRKLQNLAMERAKQLGVVRQQEVHVTEIVDALKTIGNTVFPAEPTQSYRDYNRVPGTGLPHIVQHLEELQADIRAFVQLSAKLNLELSHEMDMLKRQRIGSDVNNEFLRLWQFANDLSRATPSKGQQIVTPGRNQLVGSGNAKAKGKEPADDDKVHNKPEKVNTEQGKSGEGSGVKVGRKTKPTGAEAGE